MKKALILILFVLLAISVNAQLYGDLEFDVKDTGEVEISGPTNYEAFQGITNELTSKEKNIWSLNITSPNFDNYEYVITLPKYAAINYITANNKFVIGEKGGVVAVAGTGIGKPLNVFIEYSIDKENGFFDSSLIIAGLVLLLIIGAVVYFIKRKPAAKPKSAIKRELYTERQLKILDYLQKHGTVTQAKLEKDLKIPKASLSRNIRTLAQKGVIFSETKGMSNIVGLK